MINLKTRAVTPFPPDARTFHNIYKLQKHVLLRHQLYLIVFMGSKKITILADNAPLNKCKKAACQINILKGISTHLNRLAKLTIYGSFII